MHWYSVFAPPMSHPQLHPLHRGLEHLDFDHTLIGNPGRPGGSLWKASNSKFLLQLAGIGDVNPSECSYTTSHEQRGWRELERGMAVRMHTEGDAVFAPELSSVRSDDPCGATDARQRKPADESDGDAKPVGSLHEIPLGNVQGTIVSRDLPQFRG